MSALFRAPKLPSLGRFRVVAKRAYHYAYEAEESILPNTVDTSSPEFKVGLMTLYRFVHS
jgi:hypothetical protein